jgi:hypothetical protein
VNLYLFINIIDEHGKNYSEFLRIFNCLVNLVNKLLFRWRLCLVNRPENIFRDAFEGCPRFTIYKFISGDIRLFAINKMQDSLKKELTPDDLIKLVN